MFFEPLTTFEQKGSNKKAINVFGYIIRMVPMRRRGRLLNVVKGS